MTWGLHKIQAQAMLGPRAVVWTPRFWGKTYERSKLHFILNCCRGKWRKMKHVQRCVLPPLPPLTLGCWMLHHAATFMRARAPLAVPLQICTSLSSIMWRALNHRLGTKWWKHMWCAFPTPTTHKTGAWLLGLDGDVVEQHQLMLHSQSAGVRSVCIKYVIFKGTVHQKSHLISNTDKIYIKM